MHVILSHVLIFPRLIYVWFAYRCLFYPGGLKLDLSNLLMERFFGPIILGINFPEPFVTCLFTFRPTFQITLFSQFYFFLTFLRDNLHAMNNIRQSLKRKWYVKLKFICSGYGVKYTIIKKEKM